jgi:hypothetical protein
VHETGTVVGTNLCIPRPLKFVVESEELGGIGGKEAKSVCTVDLRIIFQRQYIAAGRLTSPPLSVMTLVSIVRAFVSLLPVM